MTATQLDTVLASTGQGQRGTQTFYIPALILRLLRRVVALNVQVLPGQPNLAVPATIDVYGTLSALLGTLGQDNNGHKLRLSPPLRKFIAGVIFRSARNSDGTLVADTVTVEAPTNPGQN